MDSLEESDIEPKQTGWVLFSTVLASGMAFLLGAAISIALPTIQNDLEANISGLQWIINSYTLTLAVFILIGGSLSDIFGRKRIFSYGILIFVMGSLLSGLSDTVEKLIFFQAFQGIGAAFMIPGSLAIINSCIPEFRRGKAIGQWAGYSGGIGALGPFLGGWLVETLGWQSIFFLNVPIGLLAFWSANRFIPESSNPDAGGIDWPGAILIAIGLFGLSYGLIKGPLAGWDNWIVGFSISIGVIMTGLFILFEKRSSKPMVPFKIFKNPLVTGANLMTFLLYFALYGVTFFLVINMQQFQGYSPIKTGLALLPLFLIITFLSGPAGKLSDRIGPRPQMIVGPAIVSMGMALFIIPGVGAKYTIHFLPGLLLFGTGMAIVIAPLTKSALAVEQKYSGVASGVNNSISRVAALMAVALLGAIVVTLFNSHLGAGMRGSGLSPDEQQSIIVQAERLGGIEIPGGFDEENWIIAKKVVNDSFIFGFRWAIALGAFLALMSSVAAALTIPAALKGQ
jgi:EmrB/QacA subfamily drug resistance transporter